MAITTTEHARQRRSGACPAPYKNIIRIAAVASLAVAMQPAVQASEWRFTPSVGVTETLTDNVNLAVRGQEKGDLVTQVTPGFTLTNTNPRLQTNIVYSLQSTIHTTSGDGADLSNQLAATLRAILVRDLLFVDATAAVGQQSISLFGARSADNTSANNNRTDVRSYTISPYLVNRIGNVAVSQLRYTHEGVSAGSNALANSNTDRLLLKIDSGPRYTRVNWGAQVQTQVTQYGDIQDVHQSSATVNAGYLLVPTLRLIATGGYEKNDFVTTGSEPQGAFYNAGFAWTPSSRTSVTATTGHRYFGRTYSLAANHRARNTVVSINYTDDITNSQAQIANGGLIDTAAQLNLLYAPQFADAALRQQFVQGLIRQFGLPASLGTPVYSLTNRYFLQKSLQASVSVNSSRSTIVGTLFNTKREAIQGQQTLQTAALGFDDNTKQLGATALWNLQLSGRTSALANATITRNTSLTTNRVDNYKLVRVGMSTTFQPKLTGNVELRHSQQSSDFLGGDIRENAVTATVLMQF